ncbi:MAG TPA: proton-conducting transporter membrane subunit [Urbifossiella sp.]|nr:proton-conducting transporter membrane subunit [Urbifossiella sp.]
MPDLFPSLDTPAAVSAALGAAVVALPALLVAVLGVASLAGRPLSERATARAVAATTGLALLAAVAVLVHMLATDSHHVVIGFGEWVHIGSHTDAAHYHFAVKFIFDRLSVPFVALSLVLCGTIGAFADRYMHREPGYNRFFVLYSVFTAGMVTTALAGTIETLFLGWELVGLSSALLVGFFHDRPAPVRNALRVWVVYRVSDAALLLAAVVLHKLSGEGDLDQLTGYHADPEAWPFGHCPLTEVQALLVGGLLVVAAAGKSALVPFSGWLPRAMEGPTPSSAVFYGALSVHLGAYLLLRAGPVLDASPLLSWVVVALGLVTAGYAALVGRVQTDIKSILSFASLAQVGLIVAEIGLGWRYVPLAHLMGHACLRTLQFVRAPSAIRDHSGIENALGGRQARGGGWFGVRVYRFALERGHLDALLDRFIADPFVRFFRACTAAEERATAWLAGAAAAGGSREPAVGSGPVAAGFSPRPPAAEHRGATPL